MPRQYHPVAIRMLTLITSVVAGYLLYTPFLGWYGNPYINRSEGANGICPRIFDSAQGWVFQCADESQRQAAAQVVAGRYETYATVEAVIAGILVLCVIMWLVDLYEKRIGYADPPKKGPIRNHSRGYNPRRI